MIFSFCNGNQLSRGGIFIIGLVGQTDTNIFEITATITNPEEIRFLSPKNVLHPSILPSRIEYSLESSSYRFFAIKIDPRQRGKIIININNIFDNNDNSNDSNNNNNNNQNINIDSNSNYNNNGSDNNKYKKNNYDKNSINVNNLVSSEIDDLQGYGRGENIFIIYF